MNNESVDIALQIAPKYSRTIQRLTTRAEKIAHPTESRIALHHPRFD